MSRRLLYTSYSPNTRKQDLLVNKEIKKDKDSWYVGESIENVKELFTSYYPDHKVYTFNYARSALYALFSSLEHESDDEVIFQGFTCAVASLPAKWAGYTVKYVDIDEETLSYDLVKLAESISNKTKIIVIQYTLGCSPDIAGIKEIVSGKNITVIEDCTHYLPYPSEHPNPRLGAHFDHAIFSFGRDKIISSVDGGVLISRNIVNKLEKSYEDLRYPSEDWVVNRLNYSPVWQSIKDHYFTFGKLIHLIQTKRGVIRNATSDEEKLGKRPVDIPALLPNAMAKLAMTQLEDIDQIQQHRYEISEIYTEFLKDERDFRIYSDFELPPLRYPILHKHRDLILESMKLNHYVILGDWYDRPIAPRTFPNDVTGYITGSCPNSERISSEIFNLPTHINISKDDAKYIAQSLIEINSNINKNDQI